MEWLPIWARWTLGVAVVLVFLVGATWLLRGLSKMDTFE